MTALLNLLFGCTHPRYTWPHLDENGDAYVCCLSCAKELPYDLERMEVAA